MTEKKTATKAKATKRAGQGDSAAAGEFVREEMHHLHEGDGPAQSTKQAIAIGLSKARRAGVKVKVPAKGAASEEVREKAKRDNAAGQRKRTRKAA